MRNINRKIVLVAGKSIAMPNKTSVPGVRRAARIRGRRL